MVLEEVSYVWGVPGSLRVDDRSEFTCRAPDLRAHLRWATPDFSRPGKPTDNAYVELFNGHLREERPSQHYLTSVDDARGTAESVAGRLQ